MKKMFLMVAIGPAMVVGFSARAAELPSFELTGFPITWHQVAVMGASGVQEQSPAPRLESAGMPASPHQIAVLTPRQSMIAQKKAPKLTTVGFSPR
ncbi:hypothetical protein QA640_42860 [Bradyrhizobium sp. CB82]|uniref:hypothetical protein n=1 Tax=Bradyrhizobium sp. CB82 TaxID=3039159 RepID=UPI0024B21469|nr:hypothetical protein [Bradyrhizobium sp. CB82]WFU40822.1 hypothetical protein QA640_42860 [Bradyrhizobium sp. CB82]